MLFSWPSTFGHVSSAGQRRASRISGLIVGLHGRGVDCRGTGTTVAGCEERPKVHVPAEFRQAYHPPDPRGVPLTLSPPAMAGEGEAGIPTQAGTSLTGNPAGRPARPSGSVHYRWQNHPRYRADGSRPLVPEGLGKFIPEFPMRAHRFEIALPPWQRKRPGSPSP